MKINNTLFLNFFILTFFCIQVSVYSETEKASKSSYSIDFFDNRTQCSPVISADVEQPAFCSRFMKSTEGTLNDKYYLDMSFGSDAPLMRVTRNVLFFPYEFLSVNVKGLMRSRFGFKTKSFNQFASDFYGGLSITIRPPVKNMTFEIYTYHQSSHFGDDYVLASQPTQVNYSHEVIRIMHFMSFFDNLKLSYGLHYDLRCDTSMPKGRAVWQVDGRYDAELFKEKVFLGFDFKSREVNKWTPCYQIQAGWQISSGSTSVTKPLLQSIIFEYYNGFSNFGQFITQREETFLLGIMVNI